MSDTKETTLGLLRTLSPLCATDLGGAQLAGIHLEGPFLSKEYKGAMPEECLLRADPALLENYLTEAKGTVKYITVAPEVEGVIDMIKSFRKDLVFAIGHSGADYDTAMMNSGLTRANCMLCSRRMRCRPWPTCGRCIAAQEIHLIVSA